MTTSSRCLRTNVNVIELDHLWGRYEDEADQRARERLVFAYRPLVSYAGSRVGSGLPSHVDEAELVSQGLLGLVKAVEQASIPLARSSQDRDCRALLKPSGSIRSILSGSQ